MGRPDTRKLRKNTKYKGGTGKGKVRKNANCSMGTTVGRTGIEKMQIPKELAQFFVVLKLEICCKMFNEGE